MESDSVSVCSHKEQNEMQWYFRSFSKSANRLLSCYTYPGTWSNPGKQPSRAEMVTCGCSDWYIEVRDKPLLTTPKIGMILIAIPQCSWLELEIICGTQIQHCKHHRFMVLRWEFAIRTWLCGASHYPFLGLSSLTKGNSPLSLENVNAWSWYSRLFASRTRSRRACLIISYTVAL